MGRLFRRLRVFIARVLLWIAKRLAGLAFKVVSKEDALEIFPEFVEENVSHLRQVFDLKPFRLGLNRFKTRVKEYAISRFRISNRFRLKGLKVWA